MSAYDETTELPREDRADRADRATGDRRTGRHPVNTGHLVMGVAFLGLVVVWALLVSDTVLLADARWLLPLPWLVGGAAGLLATLFRGRQVDRP